MLRSCTVTPHGYELTGPLLELVVVQQAVWGIVERLQRDDESYEEPTDPFAAWASQMELPDEDDEDEPDAVERRLFPKAYPDDDRAAAEFRRYTQTDQRRQKVREAYVVIEGIDHALEETMLAHGWSDPREIDGTVSMTVRIEPEEYEPWLRATNAARLIMSVELGVSDADDAERLDQLPDDDPRSTQAAIYELVGMYQAILLLD